MLRTLQNSLKSIFNFDGKTKFNVALDICFLFFFFATVVTIPIFSFRTQFTIITWGLTIITFVVITLEMILFYKIKIDIIVASLILFLFSGLLSSAINGFKSFVLTPLLLNLVVIIIYVYLKGNPTIIKPTIYTIYIALSVFVMVYLVMYRKDVFSFNRERLGDAFGDQNDISLFLSLCFLFSAFFVLNSKLISKIFAALIGAFSFLCGASTGSKVFIITAVISLLVAIIVSFGKKRWYLSIIVIAALIILAAILFSLPFMANLKNRMLTFINSFFDIGYRSTSGVDSSSFDRYHLFRASFELFLTKPLLGYGVNGFQNANGFFNGWSHNNIGEFLSDFGLIGTILFNAPIIFSVICFYDKRTKNETIPSRLAFLIIVFFVCAMLSVAYTREKIYSYIIPVAFATLFNEKCFFEFSIKGKTMCFLTAKKGA